MSFCSNLITSKGRHGLDIIISPENNSRFEGSIFEYIVNNGGKVIYGKVKEDGTVRIVAEFADENKRKEARKQIWNLLLSKASDDDEEPDK